MLTIAIMNLHFAYENQIDLKVLHIKKQANMIINVNLFAFIFICLFPIPLLISNPASAYLINYIITPVFCP